MRCNYHDGRLWLESEYSLVLAILNLGLKKYYKSEMTTMLRILKDIFKILYERCVQRMVYNVWCTTREGLGKKWEDLEDKY